MVLNQGVAGFPFAGADVGGFFGNPSKELQTRWYQAGAFYPFFRAHAHIDTRRREPYLLGEPYTSIMTQALRLRYSLLPAWYNAFHTSSTTGAPIIRAQYYVHPTDEAGFAIDDQFYLGDTGLLVKPITAEDAVSTSIYIADDETYYDYTTFKTYTGAGKHHDFAAPLDKIPILMQGGHIFARKDRPRRSSGLMKHDPYTLVIVLDKTGKASGDLYVDDGETYDHEHGAFIHRRFTCESNTLTSSDVSDETSMTWDKVQDNKKKSSYVKSMDGITIERIVIVNAPKTLADVAEVEVTESGKSSKAQVSYNAARDGHASWAVVRNPAVRIGAEWSVKLVGAADEGAKSEL